MSMSLAASAAAHAAVQQAACSSRAAAPPPPLHAPRCHAAAAAYCSLLPQRRGGGAAAARRRGGTVVVDRSYGCIRRPSHTQPHRTAECVVHHALRCRVPAHPLSATVGTVCHHQRHREPARWSAMASKMGRHGCSSAAAPLRAANIEEQVQEEYDLRGPSGASSGPPATESHRRAAGRGCTLWPLPAPVFRLRTARMQKRRVPWASPADSPSNEMLFDEI
jgi:hypothetical protein